MSAVAMSLAADHGSVPPADADCREVLEQLLQRLPDLRAAVLARSDGFEVVSVLRRDLAVSRLAAISSSMMALGHAALRELDMGKGRQVSVLVESPEGKLLLIEVVGRGPPRVLALVGDVQVVTGALLWAARDAAVQLSSLPPVSLSGVH